ncbi:MAG: hypothetical protein ACK4EY_16155 [Flavipsychrobacter sp.]
MQTIKTVRNQTILNLALQLYGNEDAADELLALNDFTGKMVQPAFLASNEVDLAYSVQEGVTIVYDEASANIVQRALQELHGDKWKTRNGVIIADGLAAADFRVYNNVYNNVFG